MEELGELKFLVDKWQSLNQALEDAATLLELALEEGDKETEDEAVRELDRLEDRINRFESELSLSGKDDKRNAILSINPGAGGTESQDWALMLMRMYLRWAEVNGYKAKVLDMQPAEEAGIKQAIVEVEGRFAYGKLRSEVGVHRLVRISPYDFNSRRHTSFASFALYPVTEKVPEIEVEDADLKVETFRASGAGGQHVNKTSSAVRLTHIPTGIKVQCQTERSQHRNRVNAMKILLARLYQRYLEEEKKRVSELQKEKLDIAWGSQIRSYIFHPYNLVKDHRTGAETSNVQAVMDGNINRFIDAFLTSEYNK